MLADLFKVSTRGKVKQTMRSLEAAARGGLDPADAWNATSVELTQMALAHVRLV